MLKMHWFTLVPLFSIWGTYFVILFSRIVTWKPDGLYLGYDHVWSDWPLHIGMTQLFALKDPQYWFLYHPMYAYGQFNYGFLTNFISGMLMRLGLSLQASLVIPSIFFSFLLLGGTYSLLYILLRSQWQAFLSISLFFLSSGLGFLTFLQDLSPETLLQFFLHPQKDYSRVDDIQWYTGNVIEGMLIPQRAFLLGMTITIWVLTGLLYVLLKKTPVTPQDKLILLSAGFAAGLLPITHIHSFIVLVIISTFIALAAFRKWILLLFYVIPAGILSAFFYLLFIHRGIENAQGFFTWYPGWNVKEGFFAWIKTWLYLWGAMIPLAALGLFFNIKTRPRLIAVFFLSFFALFLLGNLILFQPIAWDNSKIFLWVYFGFSALTANILARYWRMYTLGRTVIVALIIILTLTGALQLIQLQRAVQTPLLATPLKDIQLGIQIREQTEPLAVFLTESSHNHFVMMWGLRPILMGFTAWVGNFGFQFQQTEQDMFTMFQGGIRAEDLLKTYTISYVVIGHGEIARFKADETYFQSRFPLAFQNENYRVYDVRSVWQ